MSISSKIPLREVYSIFSIFAFLAQKLKVLKYLQLVLLKTRRYRRCYPTHCQMSINRRKIKSGTTYLGKGFCLDLLFWVAILWAKLRAIRKDG